MKGKKPKERVLKSYSKSFPKGESNGFVAEYVLVKKADVKKRKGN